MHGEKSPSDLLWNYPADHSVNELDRHFKL